MQKEEDIEKFFKEKEEKFFKENFYQKNFKEAVNDNFIEGIIKLANIECYFIFLYNSYKSLRTDKKYYQSLNKKDKETLKNFIKKADRMVDKLDKIINKVSFNIEK